MIKGKKKLKDSDIKRLKLMLRTNHNFDIAKEFNLDRSTICYYRKKFNLDYRKIKKKIKVKYQYPNRYNNPFKTYEDYITEDEMKRIKKENSCQHNIWIKRCSCCGKILESDKCKNY